MLISRPTKTQQVTEGKQVLKISEVIPKYDVTWFGKPNTDVVDIKSITENGEEIVQRETLSFHEKSNLYKLIYATTGEKLKPETKDYDENKLIGKKYIGTIQGRDTVKGIRYYVKNYERIKLQVTGEI